MLSKKRKTKVVLEEEIIAERIVDNIEEINELNKILEKFIDYIEQKDYSNSEKVLTSLKTVFLQCYSKPKLNENVKQFLNCKFKVLSSLIYDLIAEDTFHPLAGSYINLYKIYRKRPEEIQNYLSTLNNLFILPMESTNPYMIKEISDSISREEDLNMLLNEIKSSLEKSSKFNFYNIYNLLLAIKEIQLPECKLNYQNILITLLNSTLFPQDITKNFFQYLNKNILENLANPLVVSDFIIATYEATCELDIKILCLSGLFILITKHKLDYPNYYKMLYRCICLQNCGTSKQMTAFDSKNRKRLLKIMDLSLQSQNLSIVVVSSFIKKLGRVALKEDADNCYIILSLIKKLMILHPKTKCMLGVKSIEGSHYATSEEVFGISTNSKKGKNIEDMDEVEYLAKFENFNENELDPFKTNAEKSYLWELYTLQNHFSAPVRKICKSMKNYFAKSNEIQQDISVVKPISEKYKLIFNEIHAENHNSIRSQIYNLLQS